MANPYLLRAAPLRTGLALPQTRLWGFCKVVVLRPSAQKETFKKETFTVKFSQHELAPGATNDCLFRAITARVPFAEWEKMESYLKFIDTSIVQGRRRVCVRGAYEWPKRYWRPELSQEQDTDATEECARKQIYNVQYGLYLGCIDPDENYETTVVIYALFR
jgi:hypothetical protein